MIILETKNLIKQFGGIHAVDHLSISVEKGKIIGIIGPNGSGKTTLINLLSGMLNMDGGLVIISDTYKLTKILPHKIFSYGLTRTFQNVRLFEQMTVLDNILVILTERNIFGAFFTTHNKYHLQKAKEVLQKVNLWDKKDHLVNALSYGQRKLLEIARVLSVNLYCEQNISFHRRADIYLFDEPFAGLFPQMRKIVSHIILELKKENKTSILIEHDMGLIRELCDHVLVMDEGKLLTEGSPENVLEKKEVISAYLGE